MERLEKINLVLLEKPEFIKGSGKKRDRFRDCGFLQMAIFQVAKSVLIGALRIPSLNLCFVP